MNRTPSKVFGALAFVAGVAILIPAIQAFAHAAYDHSSPAKDEVVPTRPAQVDAYFTQNIFRQTGEYYLRVYADDNTTQVSPGDGTNDDNNRRHLFTTMPTNAPNGRYIVHWKTKSDEDGHTDSGMYCFYIAVQPTAQQQAECASFASTAVTPAPTTAGSLTPAAAATTAPLPGTGTGPQPSDSTNWWLYGLLGAAVVALGGVGLAYARRKV